MFGDLRNVRIKTISYGIIAFMIVAGAIVLAVSLTTLSEANSTKAAWDAYDTGAGRRSRIMSDLRDALGYGGMIHNYKNAILRRDFNLLETAQDKGRGAKAAIQEYRDQQINSEEATAIDQIEAMVDDYLAKIPKIEQSLRSGATIEQVDRVATVGDDDAVAAFDMIDRLLRAERAEAETLVYEGVGKSQVLTYASLITVGAMVFVTTVVFLWFARSRLITPIYGLMEFVSRVGKGDLSTLLSNPGRDEVGSLGSHLNAMVSNLKEITLQTREAVSNLNSAAAETLASTKQQAASVEEQFAAIQETTATLDEISQSSQQMTKRANEVVQQAEQTSERSQEGVSAMDDMARVMDEIEEQTESVASHIISLSERTQAIGDIISSVNDIAERCQLLALNAAIEAAAAGDEGRSFAVVAEEIKSLADQSKSATSQVSSILGDIQKGINSSVMSTEESVKRVANGRERAERALKLINDFAETSGATVQAFEQIVAASNQQRSGLEQVTEALLQIRTGSEQTASGTKQIEQAVTNINALGSQLDHTMERYAV